MVEVNAAVKFSSPTAATVWIPGSKVYISWDGDCADMPIPVVSLELIAGTTLSSYYVATLNTIDCSAGSSRAAIDVPVNLPPTEFFALKLNTLPSASYSAFFTIRDSSKTNSLSPSSSPTNTRLPSDPSETPTQTLSPAIIGVVVVMLVFIVGVVLLFWRRRRNRKVKGTLDSTNRLGNDSAKIEDVQLPFDYGDNIQKEAIYEPHNDHVVGNDQAQVAKYTLNFSAHPRPNVVTIVVGGEEQKKLSETPVVWEPNPYASTPPSAPLSAPPSTHPN
ncbi:hypothetical protein BGZ76_004250 [Entomortierella beljakovae]|nr:hypothetical protein BGZ76_004250 [Entomortierella beljakovae]